jgi:hypothetical protein
LPICGFVRNKRKIGEVVEVDPLLFSSAMISYHVSNLHSTSIDKVPMEEARWKALFPGTFVPVLMLRADCSTLRNWPTFGDSSPSADCFKNLCQRQTRFSETLS